MAVRTLLIMLLSVLLFSTGLKAQDHTNAFITIWDTEKMDVNTTLAIPSSGTNYNYYWEKTSDPAINSGATYSTNSGALNLTTIVAKTGIYRLYIKAGYTAINMGNNANSAKALLAVESWGNINWITMTRAFQNCINLSTLPVAAPDLSTVTDMSYMFDRDSSLNSPINNWNTSTITNMSWVFYGAAKFNQPLNNWNTANVTVLNGMFSDAKFFNQDISGWNTEKVTDMSALFKGASSFNQAIGIWKTDNLISTNSMFMVAGAFNQPLNDWNTEKLTDMWGMFWGTSKFNQPLHSWKTGAVSEMSYMFWGAHSFNQNIGNWQLKPGVNLINMLSNNNFNCYNYSLTLKGWAENVSTPDNLNLTATGRRYSADAGQYRDILIAKGWTITDEGINNYCGTATADHFNTFITIWDTDKMDVNTTLTVPSSGANYSYYWEKIADPAVNSGLVYNANSNSLILTGIAANTGKYKLYIKGNYTAIRMVSNANSAKALIAVETWGNINWNTMNSAFANCVNLVTLPTEAPNLGNVTDMSFMFNWATSFNAHIGNWNTANVTNMRSMFSRAFSFNQPIGNWNTTNVTNMREMFAADTIFNQPISNWNTANVTSMAAMFYQAYVFDQPVGNWNTANVTDMKEMFRGAKIFNQPIDTWSTKKVKDMSYMFCEASLFNQPIGSWNTDSITHMISLFDGAVSFNQPIGNWNTANVKDMGVMFQSAAVFNQDISNWKTDSVTNMSFMFNKATVFNQPIGNWNTEKVTSMRAMFQLATAFNGDVSSWITGNVTDMSYMFNVASAFNQHIGNWNTGKVTNMQSMLQGAYAFNQDIGNWNTEKVDNMSFIFNSAIAFNQNLGSWKLKPGVNLSAMLNNTSLNCLNYGSTLQSWAQNSNTPNGLNLGAINIKYASTAQQYRDILTGTKGWTITDWGIDNTCNVLPVQLISYQAKLQNTTVLLSWQTTSEINNSHFILERSTDGLHFSFLKNIAANAGGNTASSYQYTDAHPAKGSNYYRLSQVDIDGKTLVYGIRTVNVTSDVSGSVVLYPNPVNNEPVTVKFAFNSYNKAILLNVSGQLIASKNIAVQDQQIMFDTHLLAPGTYIIQLIGKQNSIQKFIKQ